MVKLKTGESIELGRVIQHDHLSALAGNPLLYVPPIGSIIYHYDFNAGLTFSSTYWKYCDGASGVTVGALSGQTLPDLSGRYLVGFGSDGGGDVDSATWATSVVGAASNQISLAHSHTVNAHSHTVNSHTHSVSSHTHGVSSAGSHSHAGRTTGMSTSATETNPNYRIKENGGWTNFPSAHISADTGTGGDEGNHDHNISTDGSHSHSIASGGGGSTGSSTPGTSTSSPGTDSQLSTTQSIQPRSIRARAIMRVL